MTTCCNHDCVQGRTCPLRQNDGGMHVNGRMSFPIESEEDDTPVITPEAAESAWKVAQDVLAFIAVALLAFAAVALRSRGLR